MIHIVICDDEKYMLDQIRAMVKFFFKKKNIEISISQLSSGEELLRYDKIIDILFLDIQMKHMNGMETAKRLRNRNYKGFLIFITILKEMVFDSFEVQAYDYLIKPIQKEQFEKTMERLLNSIEENARKDSLFIQKGNESSIIFFDDIIFCEIINRKVYLHLKNSEVLDYYEKMETLEKKLDKRFFRCHRSYLINLKYLKSYNNNMASMADGKIIPISRLRSREFSEVILQYMKEWR